MEKRYPRTILATVCVPWKEDLSLDEECFRRQIQLLLGKGLKHLYLFGTAGEGYGVTDRQYHDIVKIFAEEMAGKDRFPMVGQIHLSLASQVERIELARTFGIRDFQCSFPCWSELSDVEVESYFRMICGRFPDCRFLHYNLPRSKKVLTPAQYHRLGATFSNLVGAKYVTNDTLTIGQLVEPGPLQFFLGQFGFGYGSLLGECGYLVSLGVINMAETWRFFGHAIAGNVEEIVRYSREIAILSNELKRFAGFGRIDGTYDKVFARLVDPQFPLRLMPPYEGCSDMHFEQFSNFLKEEMPSWVNI